MIFLLEFSYTSMSKYKYYKKVRFDMAVVISFWWVSLCREPREPINGIILKHFHTITFNTQTLCSVQNSGISLADVSMLMAYDFPPHFPTFHEL